MSAGHTPGPLVVGEDPLGGDYMVCVMVPGKAGQYGTEVARCDHNWNDACAGDRRISWAEAEANARLFAAAPDLLEALEVAAEELEYFVEFARNQFAFEGDADAGFAAVASARAAIAKAKAK